jgi:hypothetical protein
MDEVSVYTEDGLRIAVHAGVPHPFVDLAVYIDDGPEPEAEYHLSPHAAKRLAFILDTSVGS